MTEKTKKILLKVANVLLTIFLVFAVVITIFATIGATSDTGLRHIGSTAFFIIETPSMDGENGFGQGSLIISKMLVGEQKLQLTKGDVITFLAGDLNGDGKDDYNTHRIVEEPYEEDGHVMYVTQGDASGIKDNPVKDVDVVAKWTGRKYEGLGAFLGFMSGKDGLMYLIILPLGLIFVLELINVVKMVKKSSGKKTITAKDEEEIKRKAIEEYLKSMQQSQPSDQCAESVDQADTKE